MKTLTLYWLLAITLCSCVSRPPRTASQPSLPPTVLLISFDGFRADYLDRYEAPILKAFASEGFRAEALKPAFPSLTFPNHYSIVTGLYPAHHGIVANDMYDPKSKKRFSLKDPKEIENPEWWEGEPLWVTVQKQGMKSATMFWVGSFAEIHGLRPTYWLPYDSKFPVSSRLEKILTWLDLPENERPRFITLYLDDTDTVGHATGPDSPEMKQAVSRLDQTVGDLLGRLKERGLENQIDILIVSDHGMASVESTRIYSLGEHVKSEEADLVGSGAVVGVWPKKASEKSLYARLKNLRFPMKVYRKKEIPAKYRYRDHRRIPPILLVAEEGNYISPGLKNKTPSNPVGGAHGYDNDLTSMRGILLGRGPHLKKGANVGVVENIEVYPVITQILGIKPNKNDAEKSSLPRTVVINGPGTSGAP